MEFTKNPVLQIRGPKGSKIEFFESFSKSMHWISIIIGLEETIRILDMCVKFGVMYDFGSRDMGSNGVQNGVFRLYLHRISLDFSIFGFEGGSYGT